MSITSDEAKTLGTLIAKQRKERGISSNAFARQLGFSTGWYADLEMGNFVAPSPDRLLRIADALGIDPGVMDTLMRGSLSRSLPSLRTFVRAKYRMAPEEIERVVRYVERTYGGPS